MTRSQETRKSKPKALGDLIREQTAPHQHLVRWGFRDEVETLIRTAYRLGFANGRAR